MRVVPPGALLNAGETTATKPGGRSPTRRRRGGPHEAVLLVLGSAFNKSVNSVPEATICADLNHLLMLGDRAVDTVRRDIWQLT